LPGALQRRSKVIAESYVSSVLLGVGQFCTNPGVLFLKEGPDSDEFIGYIKAVMAVQSSGVLLSKGISEAYNKSVQKLKDKDVSLVQQGVVNGNGNYATPSIWQCTAEEFLALDELREEVFGPSSIIVKAASIQEIRELLCVLDGQLTVTVHAEEEDADDAKAMMDCITNLAGRIVWNGFPTGVEVSHAMVHGGPFPATSDSRSTSVGTAAIYRFTRPVCYQNIPEDFLPDELKTSNPLNIWRLVDGDYIKNKIVQ